jgi:hypothetical protein
VIPPNDKPLPSVWYGSPSPLSPSQSAGSLDPAMGREEQSPWMVPITLWLAALAVVVAVVMYFVIAVIVGFSNVGNAFNSLGRGLEQSFKADQAAGTAANDAAAAVGPQFGSLSPSVLNTRLPKYRWVDGATNVPYSAKRPIVGMTANGTHVETAVQEMDGFCSFGLTITSSTDPLTTEDHLLGLGRYYRLVGPGTYYQSVYHAPQCAADQAPTSGWISWPQGVP